MKLRPSSNPTEPAEWSPPVSFEEYRLLGPLSRGGMGEVFLGLDALLDRTVAIKFISALNPDLAMREQFLKEARAVARIQHPNVVTVHRVGEIDGRPYIVSEYVRGRTLSELQLPVPWQHALKLGQGLARGLAAAHRCGVLHRDIKPSNAIRSDDGDVKLLDFGLAEFLDHGLQDTMEEVRPPVDPSSARRPGGAPSAAAAEAETPAAPLRPGEAPSPARDGAAPVRPPVAVPFANTIPVRVSPPSPGPPPGSDEAAGPPAPRRRGQSDPQPRRPVTRIVGTPHYMAPETWLAEPSTPQTDVYAMGALLFEKSHSVENPERVIPQGDATACKTRGCVGERSWQENG